MSLSTHHVGSKERELWATFLVAGEMFGVRVDHVQEVLAEQPLTPVPLAPAYVAGLLNLRGQIMPAVDLRRRLDLQARAPGAPCSFLVLRDRAGFVGLVVDDFGDVLELAAAGWQPPPGTLTMRQRELVFGIFPTDGCVVLGLRTDIIDQDIETDEGVRP